MVGLSIVLESHHQKGSNKVPQVINKTTMVITSNKPFSSSSSSPRPSLTHPNFTSHQPPPFLAPNFLDKCFLCKQKLLPGKDIYMYKGDKGFCSEECRYRQIFMDEEESFRKDKRFSFPSSSSSSSSSTSSSSSSSSTASAQHKGTRHRAGGFAY